MDLGPHAAFIVSAYAIDKQTVFAIVAVVGLVVTGVGPALLPWATAQPGPKTPADSTPALPPRKVSGKWEYTYVEVARPVSETAFESACRNMEPEGWDYCGRHLGR